MLEAAFIEARRARPVKVAGQATGERGAGKATRTGELGKHYFPIISEVAAVFLSIADCIFSSLP